MKKDKEKHTA